MAFRWKTNGPWARVDGSPPQTLAAAGDAVTVQAIRYAGQFAVPETAPTVTSSVPDQAWTVGQAITGLDLSGHVTGADVTFALAPSSAALPAGVSLSAAGVLSGTPTATWTGTVVVRASNPGGHVDLGFSAAVAPAPNVTINTEANNTASISPVGLSTMSITVTDEPWASRGSWPVSVSIAALAAGPVNLVGPRIAGTAAVGQTLTVSTGLWIYDGEAMVEPTLSHQWRRNGTAIAGATGASYVLTEADAGATITVTETATSGAASAAATSAGLAIPASGLAAVGGAGTIAVSSYGIVPTPTATGGVESITINSWG